jgi:hypothetical protein
MFIVGGSFPWWRYRNDPVLAYSMPWKRAVHPIIPGRAAEPGIQRAGFARADRIGGVATLDSGFRCAAPE